MKQKPKEIFRERLSNEFLAALQSDEHFIWHCGWMRLKHCNGITRIPYRGVNRLMLAVHAARFGFQDPRWFTYNQIYNLKRIDGVKKVVPGAYHEGEWSFKGAKGAQRGTGAMLEYWYLYSRTERRTVPWEEYYKLNDEDREELDCRINSSYFTVFNADQIDGVPPLDLPRNEDVDVVSYVDAIREGMNIPVHYKGMDAFYSASKDEITLPEKHLFENNYELASTLLHELAHATGHQDRLNRFSLQHYGLERPREELVAEIASAFMAVDLEPTQAQIDSHKGYVQGWASYIKSDSNVLYEAVKDAEKACAYMEAFTKTEGENKGAA